MDEISNHKWQYAFKQAIRASGNIDKFKAIYYCGSRIIINDRGDIKAGVTVAVNNETARFFGTTSCKNPWVCPVCNARVMAKHATRIAAAIEALESPKYNQWAVMLTATVPHTSGMSCDETTEILWNAWSSFIVHGKKVTEKNTTSGQFLKYDPFLAFCSYFNCKYNIKVAEYTHGDAGWHPHFHCLFFIDADKFDEVIDWQERLEKRFTELCKRATLKVWNKKYPDKKEDNKTRLEIMYNNLNDGSHRIYISVDNARKPIRQRSSRYICGWGGDRELTGNYLNKATHEGHQTPTQILEKACEHSEDELWNPLNPYMKLYLEYAITTSGGKKHRRVCITRGLKKIIDEYLASHDAIEFEKKTKSQDTVGEWRPVFWFSASQWEDLLWTEAEFRIPLRHLVLKEARAPDPEKAILKLFEKLHIPFKYEGLPNYYENTFFNCRIA